MECCIDRLPNELLEKIFLASADKRTKLTRASPESLSEGIATDLGTWNERISSKGPELIPGISEIRKVSHLWHNLIQNNPCFWSMTLFIDHRDQTDTIELLKKSRNCTLDIVLNAYGTNISAVNLGALVAHGQQIRVLVLEVSGDDILNSLFASLSNIHWTRLEHLFVCRPLNSKRIADPERLDLSSATGLRSMSLANTGAVSSMVLPQRMQQFRSLLISQWNSSTGSFRPVSWPSVENILTRNSHIPHVAFLATFCDFNHPSVEPDVLRLPTISSLEALNLDTLWSLQQRLRADSLVDLEIHCLFAEGENAGYGFQRFSNLKQLTLKIRDWTLRLEQFLSEAMPSSLETLTAHLETRSFQFQIDYPRSFPHIDTLVVGFKTYQPHFGDIMSRFNKLSVVRRLVIESSVLVRLWRAILPNNASLFPELCHLDCRKLLPDDIDALLQALCKSKLQTFTQYSSFTIRASLVAPFPLKNKIAEGFSSLSSLEFLRTVVISVDTTGLARTANPLFLFPYVENMSLFIPLGDATRSLGASGPDCAPGDRPSNVAEEDLEAIRKLFIPKNEDVLVPKLKNLHLVIENNNWEWERVAHEIAQWREMKGVPLISCITRQNENEAGRNWVRNQYQREWPIAYDYDWDCPNPARSVPWITRPSDRKRLIRKTV
jgi:hypothetical protein